MENVNVALITAVLSALLGAAVLFANHRRLTNQALAFTCFHFTAWLLLVQFQSTSDRHWATFARANAMVSLFFPWSFALILESLFLKTQRPSDLILRTLPWLAVAALLCFLTLPDAFIVAPSRATQKRGYLYYIHIISFSVLCGILVRNAINYIRCVKGVAKIEITCIITSFGFGGLLAAVLTAIGNIANIPLAKWIGLVIIFIVFAIIAWGTTIYRIFDIRQQLNVAIQRFTSAIFLISSTAMTAPFWRKIAPPPADFVLNITLWSILTLWIDRKAQLWLFDYHTKTLADLRHLIIEAGTSELQTSALIFKFENLLAQHFSCKDCIIFTTSPIGYAGKHAYLKKTAPALAALCDYGWITSEVIERRRANKCLIDLGCFMTNNSLALALAIPRGTSSPSIIIGMSEKPNKSPFTYPEIKQLKTIAELIDNIITRSQLTEQAALQATMEQVTMLSRGLAHDLKNLLTPVASFLVHTEDRYPVESTEGEVHAAARRSVRVMSEYVREALFFSERLQLFLETVDLNDLCQDVRELVARRANLRQVQLVTKLAFTSPVIADRVLLQRMLGNIIFNAIDASVPGNTVALSIEGQSSDLVRFQVSDHGFGISRENLSRVFDPYFTTKKYGDQGRGFGLGLTICQKIVNLHAGNISIQSEPSRGTTVTVDIPLSPPKCLLPTQPCLAPPLTRTE